MISTHLGQKSTKAVPSKVRESNTLPAHSLTFTSLHFTSPRKMQERRQQQQEQHPRNHMKPENQQKGEPEAYIPQLLKPLKLPDLPPSVKTADIQNNSNGGEEELPLTSPVWMPRLMYGTAGKGERTEHLVYEALRAGFRAIDTAAQPRWYDEAAVGRGIRRAVRDGVVRREDLFVRCLFLCSYLPTFRSLPSCLMWSKSFALFYSLCVSLSSLLFLFATVCSGKTVSRYVRFTPISIFIHFDSRL